MDGYQRLEHYGRNPGRVELTDREREIMRAVLDAHGSTKVAAHALGLSRATVRNVRSICYAKLGVSGAHEFWLAIGWVRLPPR